MSKKKITDVNLYELFGILSTATEQEIKKAYRKKALTCHPDKNPDNPHAADLFLELSDALAILTDIKARGAYDQTLKAKQLAKERMQVLGAKRRKLKEDLERREREAKQSSSSAKSFSSLSDEQKLQNEIERLKKEGSRILQEEQEYIRQQLKSKSSLFPSTSSQPSASKAPPSNPPSSGQSFEEFEAMVLGKLAQAAAAQKQQQKDNKPADSEPTSKSEPPIPQS